MRLTWRTDFWRYEKDFGGYSQRKWGGAEEGEVVGKWGYGVDAGGGGRVTTGGGC